MAKLCGLLALAWMVVGAPGVVLAQGAAGLLASWEGSMDGWMVNSDNGRMMSRGASYSKTGVTEGKKSLALQMIDGYQPALRHDWVQAASQLKGRKLSMDVTAPEGTLVNGVVQVAIAFNAEGVEWKAAELQAVPQDGKAHTLVFDLSAWPITAHPVWMNGFIVTNTPPGTQPKTIYLDNLRLADVPAGAANDPSGWTIYWLDNARGALRAEESALRIDLQTATASARSVELFQLGNGLVANQQYMIRFSAKADRPRKIGILVAQDANAPFKQLANVAETQVAGEWRMFSVKFRLREQAGNVRVPVLHLGGPEGTVWIRDVIVTAVSE